MKDDNIAAEAQALKEAVVNAREAGATGDDLKAAMAKHECTEAGDSLLRSASVAMDAAASSLDPALQAIGRDYERMAMDPTAAVSVGFRQQLLQALANMQSRAKAEEEAQAPKVEQPAQQAEAEKPVVGSATEAENKRRQESTVNTGLAV